MPCKCMGSVDVTLFSALSSVEGAQARSFFARKGVPFEDIDISANPEAVARMEALSGQMERPVVVIDGRVFVGFDTTELEPLVPSFF
jgi:glutaredoxin